jgi:hypothetical protein
MEKRPMAAGVDLGSIAYLRCIRRWRVRDRVLFALPLLTSLTVLYLHVTSPPPAVSQAAYEQITERMTQKEVEGIVRARPGGYGREVCWPNGRLEQEWGEATRWVRWGTKYGVLAVGFDGEGLVCGKRLEYDGYEARSARTCGRGGAGCSTDPCPSTTSASSTRRFD